MAHAGFDRSGYPGRAVLAQIYQATNAAFVAYYLPAPSHADRGWDGKLPEVEGIGFGQAVVYVGQETTGPGSHNVTDAEGAIDGADAAAKMAAEGFRDGSYCYLDLENGPPFGNLECRYVEAWANALFAAGFGVGVYCSHAMSDAVIAALKAEGFTTDLGLAPPGAKAARIWAFKVARTDPHDVAGTTLPTGEPSGSNTPAAFIWQCDDEARLTAFGGFACDLDTALTRDPSAP